MGEMGAYKLREKEPASHFPPPPLTLACRWQWHSDRYLYFHNGRTTSSSLKRHSLLPCKSTFKMVKIWILSFLNHNFWSSLTFCFTLLTSRVKYPTTRWKPARKLMMFLILVQYSLRAAFLPIPSPTSFVLDAPNPIIMTRNVFTRNSSWICRVLLCSLHLSNIPLKYSFRLIWFFR